MVCTSTSFFIDGYIPDKFLSTLYPDCLFATRLSLHFLNSVSYESNAGLKIKTLFRITVFNFDKKCKIVMFKDPRTNEAALNSLSTYQKNKEKNKSKHQNIKIACFVSWEGTNDAKKI